MACRNTERRSVLMLAGIPYIIRVHWGWVECVAMKGKEDGKYVED